MSLGLIGVRSLRAHLKINPLGLAATLNLWFTTKNTAELSPGIRLMHEWFWATAKLQYEQLGNRLLRALHIINSGQSGG